MFENDGLTAAEASLQAGLVNIGTLLEVHFELKSSTEKKYNKIFSIYKKEKVKSERFYEFLEHIIDACGCEDYTHTRFLGYNRITRRSSHSMESRIRKDQTHETVEEPTRGYAVEVLSKAKYLLSKLSLKAPVITIESKSLIISEFGQITSVLKRYLSSRKQYLNDFDSPIEQVVHFNDEFIAQQRLIPRKNISDIIQIIDSALNFITKFQYINGKIENSLRERQAGSSFLPCFLLLLTLLPSVIATFSH